MGSDRQLKFKTGLGNLDQLVVDLSSYYGKNDNISLHLFDWESGTQSDTTLTWEQARDLGEWLIEEAAKNGFPRDDLIHRTE